MTASASILKQEMTASASILKQEPNTKTVKKNFNLIWQYKSCASQHSVPYNWYASTT